MTRILKGGLTFGEKGENDWSIVSTEFYRTFYVAEFTDALQTCDVRTNDSHSFLGALF
jgi:hypothetical protein